MAEQFKMTKDGKKLYKYIGPKDVVEISIPDTVEIIDDKAFAGLANLKKVTMGKAVREIGNQAFSKTAIEAITLPASVEYIGENAFTYMTMGRQKCGFPYETTSEIKLAKGNKVYHIDGKCLYKAEDCGLVLLFCYKKSAATIDVAEGTVKISKNAFSGCNYVSHIRLPETLISIEEHAWDDCRLSSIHIPAATTKIHESNLKTLFRTYVDEYGYRTTHISVDENHPKYLSENDCFMKRSKDSVILMYSCNQRPEWFEIPNCVTHIQADFGREKTKPTEIVFPEDVCFIGKNAFSDCKKVATIIFEGEIESIEQGAFARCTALKKVVFQKGCKSIDSSAFDACKYSVLSFDGKIDAALQEFAKAKKITCHPNGAEEQAIDTPPIDFTYAVTKNAVKITGYVGNSPEVVIPSEIEGRPVITIQKEAFRNNTVVKRIIWPTTIPVISKETFFGCTALSEIVIPDTVTEIGEKAFRNCSSLKSINIPSSVVKMGDKVFECAENYYSEWHYSIQLKTIYGEPGSYAAEYARKELIRFVSVNGLTEEEEKASMYFYHEVADGISLDDYVITDDMPQSKNNYLAKNKNRLAALEVPNEIMGKPVVELSVDFHKSLYQSYGTQIEYDSIAETLIIPENLKRIRCPLIGRGIEKVTVSPRNKAILFDDYAWYEDGGSTIVDCWVDRYSIREYTIREDCIQACESFKQSFVLDKLFFPASFVKTHPNFLKNDSSWQKSNVKAIYGPGDSCMREYADILGVTFVPLDDQDVVLSDDGSILIKCPQLLSKEMYIIPDGVKEIKEGAFKGNETLREIIIPDSVEVIGAGAFAACVSLEKAVLPTKIATLPREMFAGCNNLKTVCFPKELENIEDRCFKDTSLEEICLPEGLHYIGDYAFARYFLATEVAIELPHSVRKIGISVCAGIRDITIYDTLDPDVRGAKEHYDDAAGHWNSNIGCIGIYQYENYVHCTVNSKLSEHTITVKSAESGAVKYKVFMYRKPEKVCCAMVSSWGRNAEFNFVRIDEKFSKLEDFSNKLITVINRLSYPIDLTDEMSEQYLGWLKRNSTRIYTDLIDHGNVADLVRYEPYSMLTKTNIVKLVDYAQQKGKLEIVAYLLNYKNEKL